MIDLYMVGCIIAFFACLASKELNKENWPAIIFITVFSWASIGILIGDIYNNTKNEKK